MFKIDSLCLKVDMSWVKLDVLKPGSGRGLPTYVVVKFVFNQLEEKDPDLKKMQINLVNMKALS